MGKVCTKCKEWKSSEEFYKSVDKASGLHSWCKLCDVAARPRYVQDPDVTEKRCRRCETVKPIENFSFNTRQKDGYDALCRSCKAEYSRISLYGIAPGWYDEQVELQQGRCAICGLIKPLYVDHDHSCCPGQYACGLCARKLLCDRCNRGLGFFDDDPDLLRKCADYIDENKPWKWEGGNTT